MARNVSVALTRIEFFLFISEPRFRTGCLHQRSSRALFPEWLDVSLSPMVLFWVCSKHTATRKITTCFHKLTQRQGCRRCDDAKSKLTKQRIAKCKDFLCALTPTFSQPPCSPLQGPQPLPFTPLQSHYKALSSMCIYVFVCACMYVFMFKRQRPYVAFWVSKHETYLATYKYLFWLFFFILRLFLCLYVYVLSLPHSCSH